MPSNLNIKTLPNDIILLIVNNNTLDIMDIVRLSTTCRYFHFFININELFCKKNISFTTKENTMDNVTKDNVTKKVHSLKSLNDYTDLITSWLNDYKHQVGQIYMPKKFFHSRLYQNIELRFTKNANGRCTFLITDISNIIPLYSNIQIVYEPEYKRYRLSGLDNTKRKLIVPYLLLYIGFKVLFKTHGYDFVSKFEDINISYFEQSDIDKIPLWFKKIICSPNYNGMILKQIIDGYIDFF